MVIDFDWKIDKSLLGVDSKKDKFFFSQKIISCQWEFIYIDIKYSLKIAFEYT